MLGETSTLGRFHPDFAQPPSIDIEPHRAASAAAIWTVLAHCTGRVSILPSVDGGAGLQPAAGAA
jgi:hypothetical protein